MHPPLLLATNDWLMRMTRQWCYGMHDIEILPKELTELS